VHLALDDLRYLVVGAGLTGSVIAEHIARDLGERVVVIERRDHLGGNCHSQVDPETGIEFHTYGTHVFHTSDARVWSYVRRFTSFNGYRHQVLATWRGRVYQMPINLETINAFYGRSLRPFEVDAFLAGEIAGERIGEPRNLEEKAISLVGRPLYEAFIRGYTEKQWGRPARELPVSILQRLPFRRNYDESYYFDRWQGIPEEGYTAIFERMLDHPEIELHLNVDFMDLKERVPPTCLVIYTGPIDRFFHHCEGRLECRTLRFEREVVRVADYQGTSVMNYTEAEVPFTRIHEPRHLHPERDHPGDRTLLIREYPVLDRGDNPYYPLRTPENERMLARYAARQAALPNVLFAGRLGEFRYYDMDVAIARALETYETRVRPWAHGRR
jgi:UDP-galactopyranose mutase